MALLTAEACEKIRVNPGNFADGAKKFTVINYEDEVRERKGGWDGEGITYAYVYIILCVGSVG